MKETVKMKHRILAAIMCICISAVSFFGTPEEKTGGDFTLAASSKEVNSEDDFNTMLADQIYRREVLEYYTVKNKSLGKQIVYSDLTSFQSHVNRTDPLKSGCYLSYYFSTVYYTYSGTQLKVMVVYPFQKEEMDAHFDKMDRLAEELKGETEYDTVKNVHDYLIKNFEYDHSTDMANHTDIDGFRDGRMVCSGYGLATYYLLNKVGIRTEIITGGSGDPPSDTATHLWNMVCVDGKWYNLDVTWDDEGGEGVGYEYFLKSDADFPKHRRLGMYDNTYYNTLVSGKSYPMPKTFNKNWLILGASVLFLLGVILWRRKKAAQDKERYRGYVVPEEGGFDLYPNQSADGVYQGQNVNDGYPTRGAGYGRAGNTDGRASRNREDANWKDFI